MNQAEHRCHCPNCGALVFKYAEMTPDSVVEVVCKRCKSLVKMQGYEISYRVRDSGELTVTRRSA